MRLSLVLALMAALAAGQQTDLAEVQLAGAMKKEVVDGDLKAAVEQYRKLAQNSNKSVAARALVRLGECYEKQGNTEARKAYELVLSKFADQAEAVAQARARLAALGTGASGVTYRQIWSGPKVEVMGTASPDGRYLSSVDWDTGDLVLHDLVTDSDRRITNKGTWAQSQDFAEESVISRDGKQIAFGWYSAENRRYELRMTSLQTPGFPETRRLFYSEDLNWIAPYDWSPDGKWLAVTVYRNGGALQIGLVSTQDGSLRVLKSPAPGSAKMFFSPDSKLLGFDSDDADNASRDVFVLRVDGSGETKAATGPSQDFMMGWSPDGKYLLFASDRRGAMDLWAVPMAEGRPAGMPELMRPDISPWSLGVSSSGALYVGATISNWDIQVASVDFNSGRLLSPPVKPIQTFIGHNLQPDWSPDGKYLAYKRTRWGLYSRFGDHLLAIRSVDTGRIRELRPNLRNFNLPRWAPDGRSFAAQGADWNGQQGIYRIDAQTGEAAPISVSSQGIDSLRSPQWSPDGKKIYYLRNLRSNVEQGLMELDLASGNERELIRKKLLRQLIVSPDGRYLAVHASDAPDRWPSLLIIPTAEGETRTLPQHGPPPQSPYQFSSWAPDSGAVIVHKRLDDAGKKWEWWLVPIRDGQARKLDLETPQMLSPLVSPIRVHPDGRQVAYVAGELKQEVWVLENFLPKAKK